MLCVIVASPFAGPNISIRRRNVEYAKNAMEDSFARGEAPLVSHLLYPQVLDDMDEVDRNLAIAAASAWMVKADLLAVYANLGISPGMKAEIELATLLGVVIDHRSI